MYKLSFLQLQSYIFLKHKTQTVSHQTSKRKGAHIQFANDFMDTLAFYCENGL